MDHADQRAAEVVDQGQRLVPEPELDAPAVDQAVALQQHEPGIGAHQDRGPERHQHADHAEIGDARRQLRQHIGQRIAEQRLQIAVVRALISKVVRKIRAVGGLLDQPPVMHEAEAAVVAEKRQPEQPADGDDHRRPPQGPAREAPRLKSVSRSRPRIAAEAGGVGLRDVRHRSALSSGSTMVSSAPRPSVTAARRCRDCRHGAAGRHAAHADRAAVGEPRLQQKAVALVDHGLDGAVQQVQMPGCCSPARIRSRSGRSIKRHRPAGLGPSGSFSRCPGVEKAPLDCLDRQEGRFADELGDEAVGRPLVEVAAARRAA